MSASGLARACLAGALAWGAASAPAGDAPPPPGAAPATEQAQAARLPQRVAMLARAQAELERGDAAPALDDFERAAMMLHAADAELGLIRAAMQDGQYRRALAFCAHTAGEHTDETDGGALYAWLLRAGGQAALADRVIAETLARDPADPVAVATRHALAQATPAASGVLLEPAHRMAPWPVVRGGQPAISAAVRAVGGAVLVGDGSMAIAPAAAWPAGTLWVRNGLGQASAATVDGGDATLAAAGLVALRLATPLPVGDSLESVDREPFAGSPGYALRFPAADATPAWPTMALGFFGATHAASGLRRLGFDADAPLAGAAVLDASGRLAGITTTTGDGPAGWIPAARWQASSAGAAPPVGDGASAARGRPAPDEIYERGLRRALQVLVDDSRGPRP